MGPADPHEMIVEVVETRAPRDRLANAIPIIIGLIAVIGAFLTWRSVSLGGDASGEDRRAILDTTSLQKQQLYTEAQLSFDLVAFADYRSDLASAESLEKAVADGNDASGNLARQAATFRALAKNILTSNRLIPDYISGTTSSDVKFDDARRKDDLSRGNPYIATLIDPKESAATADHLYDRHLRMIRFIVGLTGAILVLTAAQLFGGSRRLLLAGGGTGVAIVLIVMALVGDG
jgi:hypothetical protein